MTANPASNKARGMGTQHLLSAVLTVDALVKEGMAPSLAINKVVHGLAAALCSFIATVERNAGVTVDRAEMHATIDDIFASNYRMFVREESGELREIVQN